MGFQKQFMTRLCWRKIISRREHFVVNRRVLKKKIYFVDNQETDRERQQRKRDRERVRQTERERENV